MNCDEIKNLILLEFVDGETDPETHSLILSYLERCPECKAFAEQVKNQAVAPFEEVGAQEPPAEIWQNIEAKIQERNAPASAWDRVKSLLGLSRPVWAFNTFLILFIALAVFFGQNNRSNEVAQNQTEDIDVLAYVVEETDFDVDVTDGFGSDIEAYFL